MTTCHDILPWYPDMLIGYEASWKIFEHCGMKPISSKVCEDFSTKVEGVHNCSTFSKF